MYKRHLNILFNLVILFFLVGCATTTIEQGDADVNNQLLRNRISSLETQIAKLTAALEKERQENQDLLGILNEQKKEDSTQSLRKKEQQPSSESKVKNYYSFLIRIQTALKNSGFSPGVIDGKMGSRTRAALEGFQKANNLTADGRVDKLTWKLLRKYL